MPDATASGTVVPTLTDGVVTLRAHRDEDVAGVWEQSVDPVSVRWTNVPDPCSPADAAEFVHEIIPAGWAEGQWAFAVEAVDHDQGRFAGTVWLRDAGQQRAEIAYGLHPWARGRGITDRALRLLLQWGFSPAADGGRDLQTVIWWAETGNWASRKVAWRLGFSCDGTVRRWLVQRGRHTDAWVGALQREDERAPRNPWLEVPHIVGEQVVLRRHRHADVDRVLEACTDERSVHWLGQLPQPYTRAHAAGFLLHRGEGMARGTDLHWMIADPDTDELLGTVSLMHLAHGMAEVGYWAHPGARGRGVMTEAVRLAARHAFVDEVDGGLGLHRLTAFAAVDNTASRHVLEANGFAQTGLEHRAILVRDGLHDSAGYELLRAGPVSSVSAVARRG